MIAPVVVPVVPANSTFTPLQLIQVNTHLNAYQHYNYLNVSKDLMDLGQHHLMPLVKERHSKSLDWSDYFDGIQDSYYPCETMAAPTPIKVPFTDLVNESVYSTAASSSFQSQLDATQKVLKPTKASKKTSKMNRTDALSQLQTVDDSEGATTDKSAAVKPRRGRPPKLKQPVDENAPIIPKAGGGAGRGAKAKPALVHQ